VTVPNKPDRPPRRAAVYRLWDAEGTLLYIGSAYDPDHRCKEHSKKPWWPEVARRTEEWFAHRGTAYREELKAIRAEKSKYNRMGAPSYRTPDTEAVQRRKALGPLRQRLLEESWGVARAAREAARDQGASSEEAERTGKLAEIEFLENTGLFAGAVKRRREQLSAP
jgi:predicted GIY-YIG superfamily endonuclease